ncbi:hypothetical protein HanXRQr2_Chr04g0165001 [Helianthus annuus]|uniref:Uncharacterized protein n=1 Tax=Helianthus annuus TaxID=4232 RepID=A0A9K3NRP8_HELAN|nr:hypothetical protein HanXRQr2_Chr04g0165001 [Helianthus annuus]
MRDWFSLRLFKALNISTTTRTVIATVEGCRSLKILQGYAVSRFKQLSKFICIIRNIHAFKNLAM